MPIKKEYTKDGIKLTHPSGVVTVTKIEDLRRMKDSNTVEISRLQEENRQLDNDITQLEAVRKT